MSNWFGNYGNFDPSKWGNYKKEQKNQNPKDNNTQDNNQPKTSFWGNWGNSWGNTNPTPTQAPTTAPTPTQAPATTQTPTQAPTTAPTPTRPENSNGSDWGNWGGNHGWNSDDWKTAFSNGSWGNWGNSWGNTNPTPTQAPTTAPAPTQTPTEAPTTAPTPTQAPATETTPTRPEATTKPENENKVETPKTVSASEIGIKGKAAEKLNEIELIKGQEEGIYTSIDGKITVKITSSGTVITEKDVNNIINRDAAIEASGKYPANAKGTRISNYDKNGNLQGYTETTSDVDKSIEGSHTATRYYDENGKWYQTDRQYNGYHTEYTEDSKGNSTKEWYKTNSTKPYKTQTVETKVETKITTTTEGNKITRETYDAQQGIKMVVVEENGKKVSISSNEPSKLATMLPDNARKELGDALIENNITSIELKDETSGEFKNCTKYILKDDNGVNHVNIFIAKENDKDYNFVIQKVNAEIDNQDMPGEKTTGNVNYYYNKKSELYFRTEETRNTGSDANLVRLEVRYDQVIDGELFFGSYWTYREYDDYNTVETGSGSIYTYNKQGNLTEVYMPDSDDSSTGTRIKEMNNGIVKVTNYEGKNWEETQYWTINENGCVECDENGKVKNSMLPGVLKANNSLLYRTIQEVIEN